MCNYMELSGAIWSYLRLAGALWSCLYLELSEAFCNYLDLSEAIWTNLQTLLLSLLSGLTVHQDSAGTLRTTVRAVTAEGTGYIVMDVRRPLLPSEIQGSAAEAATLPSRAIFE